VNIVKSSFAASVMRAVRVVISVAVPAATRLVLVVKRTCAMPADRCANVANNPIVKGA
jgi:hypothetical protein